MKVVAKLKGSVRALFSIWGLLILLIILLGIGFAFYPGQIEDAVNTVTDDGSIETVDVEGDLLTVEVSSDHSSEYLVLIHEDSDDYLFYRTPLGAFDGEYTIDIDEEVRCDRETPPSDDFELQLITREEYVEDGVRKLETVVDDRESISLGQKYYGDEAADCDPFTPDW